jgi:hypothetical protein
MIWNASIKMNYKVSICGSLIQKIDFLQTFPYFYCDLLEFFWMRCFVLESSRKNYSHKCKRWWFLWVYLFNLKISVVACRSWKLMEILSFLLQVCNNWNLSMATYIVGNVFSCKFVTWELWQNAEKLCLRNLAGWIRTKYLELLFPGDNFHLNNKQRRKFPHL